MSVDDDESLEIPLPLEFFIEAVPLSLQADVTHLTAWKSEVGDQATARLQGHEWVHTGPMYVTILYFPSVTMQGDIDNIVKPILDGMNQRVYVDDRQVERVVVQKFEPGRTVVEIDTEVLAAALDLPPPVLYVRVDNEATKKDTMP